MIVCRSWVMAEAVTANAGIARVAGSSRSCRSAVTPLIPGSWMSIRMRSGRSSRARRTPSSPVSASARRYPLTCKTSRMSLRFLSLSSTIRISSFATGHRQREGERRAFAHLALHPDPPVVQLDELAREGQAEAGTLHLFCRRPHLAEFLEHRLLVLGSDPHPGVGHRDFGQIVMKATSHVDPAALVGELQRVGQEVQEHLLYLPLIGPDHPQALVDRALQRDPSPAGPLADQGERVLDGARQVEVRRLQLHAPGLDLGEVEDVVDQ